MVELRDQLGTTWGTRLRAFGGLWLLLGGLLAALGFGSLVLTATVVLARGRRRRRIGVLARAGARDAGCSAERRQGGSGRPTTWRAGGEAGAVATARQSSGLRREAPADAPGGRRSPQPPSAQNAVRAPSGRSLLARRPRSERGRQSCPNGPRAPRDRHCPIPRTRRTSSTRSGHSSAGKGSTSAPPRSTAPRSRSFATSATSAPRL